MQVYKNVKNVNLHLKNVSERINIYLKEIGNVSSNVSRMNSKTKHSFKEELL